jgi:hypothetical protein
MKNYHFVWILLLTTPFRLFSAEYILKLKPERWNIDQKGYHISEIRDARKDKSIGTVMNSGTIQNAGFENSITKDLLQLIHSSLTFDSTSIPVIMEMKKFRLDVKGSPAKHQDILDFSIRFYREVDGEIFELFELNGKPQMNVQGNIPEVAEKNILTAMKQSLINFDGWMKDNLNIPPMAEKVVVEFLPNIRLKPDVGDTLIWSESYQLEWTDFLGPVPPSDFAAESNCMFNYKAKSEITNGTLTLYVNFDACFIKGSSWVKDGRERDSLLLHEQYHFNICEMYARRFRKKLMQTNLSPMKIEQQVKSLFDEVWTAYVQAQNDYDEQTRHGLVTTEQIRWMREVDGELLP